MRLSSARTSFWRGEQVVDQRVYIEVDRSGDVEQLDHIDSSPTALDRRHDRLIAVQLLGEVGLAQARTFALLDKQVDQANLS